jgi:DNA-binding response OmpR family regulator
MGAGKILIVDDEADLRGLLRDVCVMNGYQVDCANNGVGALQCIERGPYNLVIVDYEMPEMDGLEFVRRVKERWGSLPIIAMSALDVGNLFVEAGANLFLQKPFSYAVLEQKIAMITRSSSSED